MKMDAASPPGALTSTTELSAMGFSPLTLTVRDPHVVMPVGIGMNWDTTGDVPKAPGTYLFTVASGGVLRVTYVGMTTHLWMVTKGRLPSGASRPGQRYGRPRYAGATRQRVNVLVADALRRGADVQHWTRPLTDPPASRMALTELLRRDEEALIHRWNLRHCGWNRG